MTLKPEHIVEALNKKTFAAVQNGNDLPGILISWGGDDVARDSGAGLLLDVPPVPGGDLVYFLVKCGHVLNLLLILVLTRRNAGPHERPPRLGRLDLHQRRRMPSALRGGLDFTSFRW